VPIIRIPFSEADREFFHAGLDEILDSGQLTSAKYTRQFEEEFAAFSGSRFAVATSSCTTALELTLRALEIENASVVVPTNTFLATAFAVIHAGNRVIFADSDPNTLCLDVADVERRLEPGTRAVVLVHIGGIITADVEALQRLCEQRDLYLIEDCAHAHGSSLAGKPAGTFGIAGAFSFFPTKVLTTGEGGMITTDDERLYERALILRNHGKDPQLGNHITELGHNFRMSELTAMLGVEQMRKAERVIAERRAIARAYDERLQDVAGVRPLPLPSTMRSTYYKYVAYLDERFERAAVKAALKDRFGVSLTGEVYEDLCHTEPVWQRYTLCGRRRSEAGGAVCEHDVCRGDVETSFPGAEFASQRQICLPLYPSLTEEDAGYVVESLKTILDEMAA